MLDSVEYKSAVNKLGSGLSLTDAEAHAVLYVLDTYQWEQGVDQWEDSNQGVYPDQAVS